MAKKQLNVRVDATTAEIARERAEQQGISMNQSIEQDMGESGRAFVDAAAQFMKEYETSFLAEFGEPGDLQDVRR